MFRAPTHTRLVDMNKSPRKEAPWYVYVAGIAGANVVRGWLLPDGLSFAMQIGSVVVVSLLVALIITVGYRMFGDEKSAS